MESIKIARQLEGMWTIEMIAKKRNIARSTAIKIMHELRKDGFVATKGGGKQKRLYRISPKGFLHRENGKYDILNKYSKIKLNAPYEHKVMGRELTVEETIVRAVASQDYREILASLGLFNHIKNWNRLYYYAKQHNVCRGIGALYDISRSFIKVRRMDKRLRKYLLTAKQTKEYLIPGIRSKDFQEIEEHWKIKVPLNIADMQRYKEA